MLYNTNVAALLNILILCIGIFRRWAVRSLLFGNQIHSSMSIGSLMTMTTRFIVVHLKSHSSMNLYEQMKHTKFQCGDNFMPGA